MSQTAEAFVDSLVVAYGDGVQTGVPFSQSGSLKFAVNTEHTYTLGERIDSWSYVVCASAYGPSDASADLDRSTESVTVTVLRSPLAVLTLDGSLVEAGSAVEVEAGQVLSFDGALSVGFIEEAILTLDGSEILRTTSTEGLADESISGLLTVPEVPLGSELVLEYICTNTGAGLNSNRWSATLHVVPDPSTFGIFAIGAFLLVLRRSVPSRPHGE